MWTFYIDCTANIMNSVQKIYCKWSINCVKTQQEFLSHDKQFIKLFFGLFVCFISLQMH